MNSLLMINLLFPVGLPSTEPAYNPQESIPIKRTTRGMKWEFQEGKSHLVETPIRINSLTREKKKADQWMTCSKEENIWKSNSEIWFLCCF